MLCSSHNECHMIYRILYGLSSSELASWNCLLSVPFSWIILLILHVSAEDRGLSIFSEDWIRSSGYPRPSTWPQWYAHRTSFLPVLPGNLHESKDCLPLCLQHHYWRYVHYILAAKWMKIPLLPGLCTVLFLLLHSLPFFLVNSHVCCVSLSTFSASEAAAGLGAPPRCFTVSSSSLKLIIHLALLSLLLINSENSSRAEFISFFI